MHRPCTDIACSHSASQDSKCVDVAIKFDPGAVNFLRVFLARRERAVLSQLRIAR